MNFFFTHYPASFVRMLFFKLFLCSIMLIDRKYRSSDSRAARQYTKSTEKFSARESMRFFLFPVCRGILLGFWFLTSLQ